jgi:hypothetical protein
VITTEIEMFAVIGRVVVYGFAAFGLFTYLRREKAKASLGPEE